MAEVNHRYIGRIPSEGEQERQAKRDRLDAEWKQKRIDAESARQRLHEAKMLAMKGELISRKHVVKQSAFLVLSLRARLLALSAELSREFAQETDERASEEKLSSRLRSALDEIAEMPLRVTDERWLEKLDDVEQPAKHRIAK